MIKEVIHDPILLSVKSEKATIEDLQVAQDYGLAALVLGKGGKALNQNGLIYTDSNIENLLFTRHMGKKERMAGKRTRGPKKRTSQNDADFLKALLICLEHCDGVLIKLHE